MDSICMPSPHGMYPHPNMLPVHTDVVLALAIHLPNPGVPAQGYVPLGGTGTGWAVDTRGFTPVLPYL